MTKETHSKHLDHPKHAEYLAKKREDYRKNQARMREIQRFWYAKNREKCHNRKKLYNEKIGPEVLRSRARKHQKEWREAHPERVRELVRSGYQRNRVKILEHQRQNRMKLRLETFAHYGGSRCACCGEQVLEFLSLDHVNNDGAQDRSRKRVAGTSFYQQLKRRGWPEGYQVLCYNCNCAKGFWGECPHKRKSDVSRESGARI